MTDFAMLIERAIRRDLRYEFSTFLACYEHVEFGIRRSLAFDEIALVLTCADRFLIESNPLNLGITEITGLRDRLALLSRDPLPSADAVANTCFDALACITAAEARLCMLLDRLEIIRSSPLELARECANDN